MKNKIRIVLMVMMLSIISVNAKSIDHVKQQLSTKTLQAIKVEYIDFKLAKINGKVSFLTKTKLLLNIIGRTEIFFPDLNDYCGSFYNKDFKLIFVKGIDAEIYGDTAVVRSINFIKSPDLNLTTPLIKLNHNTTLANLKKIFPGAVSSSKFLHVVDLGKIIAVTIATGKEPVDILGCCFFNTAN